MSLYIAEKKNLKYKLWEESVVRLFSPLIPFSLPLQFGADGQFV